MRAFDAAMLFGNAVKLPRVSFDLTLKSNLSVGAPLSSQTVAGDRFDVTHQWPIAADAPSFIRLSSGWGRRVVEGPAGLPDYSFVSYACVPNCSPGAISSGGNGTIN